MNTPKDITVRDLALELRQPMSVILSRASGLFAQRNCPVPVFSSRGQDKSGWTLSDNAAERIRSVLAPAPAPKSTGGPVTVPELAAEMGTSTVVVHALARDLEAERPRMPAVFLDRRIDQLSGEAADRVRSVLAPAPKLVKHPVPALEAIASLVIRQDMALVDADSRALTDSISGDRTILAWALTTAGHLFDQHDLWDYDLVGDSDHVHRCFDHRHAGPGTSYPGGFGRGRWA